MSTVQAVLCVSLPAASVYPQIGTWTNVLIPAVCHLLGPVKDTNGQLSVLLDNYSITVLKNAKEPTVPVTTSVYLPNLLL